MSNRVSVLVYGRRFGSPIRKAVMAYFAERASDNGMGVWASKGTISAEIECGRSTVIRTINGLIEDGLLHAVGTKPCRNGSTIEYAMDLDRIGELPAVDSAPTKPATRPRAGPVPERDPSQSGTLPVPERDPYPSRSGTQTTIGTIIEPSSVLEPTEVVSRKRRTRLPEGWVLSDRNWRDAIDRNFEDEEIAREEDRFRDFHHAKGSTMLDWDAAWRTWLSNARKFNSTSRRKPPISPDVFRGL